MTPAARLSAAVEVLADIAARRRPAADALKDWGLAHRFAGSSIPFRHLAGSACTSHSILPVRRGSGPM